jgi:putative oxidoreductase
MKITSTIARYLLGLIFFVFGLNGFLQFLHMPPPSGMAAQFLGAMFVSHYLRVIFILELVPAILLLINRFVPLALVLLGPVVINIFLFHFLMEPSGLPLALVVIVLWLLAAAGVHTAFHGILRKHVKA